MNENLNLVEILKDCPEGTKLYSMVHGEVEFEGCSYVPDDSIIVVKLKDEVYDNYTSQGLLDGFYDGECVLFPSKDQRDWSKFEYKKPAKPKFDPKTLQPFDNVLARHGLEDDWECTSFSHFVNDTFDSYYLCAGLHYSYCIPYNDETKHLVGTKEEASEFYRYWED